MAERVRRRKKIESPFPGLRPFMSGENLIFFGREGQSEELIDRLGHNHFLAVLGSSGSGKSSLVRAGLQPDLESGLMQGVCPNWKIAVMRPGEQPIANLARELAGLVSHPEDEGFQIIPAEMMIMTMLMASSFGLKEAALGPILEADENLLVIVDQFEELFRFNDGHRDQQEFDEAKSFVRLLLEASADPKLPIYVVITMRSDFLGECPRFSGLAEAINKGQYLVPRMSRSQMREAITGPVAVFNAQIAPDLVIRILNDIGDNADQLPILQHALMRTWDHHCPGQEIVLADYEEIGGLASALDRHAEEIYQALERSGLGLVTEQLFKSLTQLEGDGKGIRRPTHLAEVCALTGGDAAQFMQVVEAFRAPGRTFLMPPYDVPLGPETLLDISHESFMRLWLRLGKWVREETQSAAGYLRLSRAAADYKAGKVNLWRQPELGIALKWREAVVPTAAWAARYDGNFEAAMSFLDESHAAWRQEEEDKASVLLLQRKSEERKHTVRRLAVLIVLLGGMLTVAVGALILAWYQNGVATEQKAIATQRADSLKTAVIENERLFREADEKRVAILALKENADSLNLLLKQRLDTIEVQRSILQGQFGATRAQRDSLQRMKDRLAKANQGLDLANTDLAQKNAEQERLRGAAEDARNKAETRSHILESLQLADRSVEAPVRETAALLALRAYNLSLENNGNTNDPRIYIALHEAAERYIPLVKVRFPTVPVAMDEDFAHGHAYVMNLAGNLYELNITDQQQQFGSKNIPGTSDTQLLGHGENRRTILLSSLSHHLMVYKGNGCHLEQELIGHTTTITGAVEIAGRQQLVSCDYGGKVLLWNLDAKPVAARSLLNQYGEQLQCMALHPNGKLVAVGGHDHILLFDLERGSPRKEVRTAGNVTAMAFAGDGHSLIFGLDNGAVGYYDMRSGSKFNYQMHKSRVSGVAFSPDNRYVATCSYDQTLRLWRTNKLTDPPIVLKGHRNWVVGLGFTADSKMLYSLSKDKTLRYWYTDAADIADALETTASRQEFSTPEMMQYNLPNREVKGGNRK